MWQYGTSPVSGISGTGGEADTNVAFVNYAKK